MPEADLLSLFAFPLGDAGINFLVSGSMASMLYGEPRVTHDIDLIVLLRKPDIPKLPAIFPSANFYLPPQEVINVECARESRGHFNILHHQSGLKADIYLAAGDELHAWAFKNKKSYSVDGRSIPLAPPEYVIVRKLEFYHEGGSEKHIRDIRSMLDVSGDQIDHVALQDWISRRHLEEAWQKVSPRRE